MPGPRNIVYVDEPPELEMRHGMVHIRVDAAGEFVMSPFTFRRSLERGHKLLADWDSGQSEPIPFKRD